MANPWDIPNPNSPMMEAPPSIFDLLNAGRAPNAAPANNPQVMSMAKPQNTMVLKKSGPSPQMQAEQNRILANRNNRPDTSVGLFKGLASQQEQADNLRDVANQTQQMPVQTDLSPLLAWADSASGAKTAQAYKAPESPEERQTKVAQLRKLAADAQGGVTKDYVSMSNSGNRSDDTLLKMMAIMAGKSGQSQTKATDKANAGLDALDASIDPNKWRGGEFGKLAGMVNSADRATTVGNQFADRGNMDSRMVADMSQAVASMVGGGGHAAEATIHRYIPDTSGNLVAKISEWFTNHPVGTDQAEFVNRMMDTSKRERDLASDKIHDVQLSRIAAKEHHRGEEGSDTDARFKGILSSHGIDPVEWEDYKANGYKRTIPSNSMPAPGTGEFTRNKDGIDKSAAEAELIRRGLLKPQGGGK